jgi:hypothetical protein
MLPGTKPPSSNEACDADLESGHAEKSGAEGLEKGAVGAVICRAFGPSTPAVKGQDEESGVDHWYADTTVRSSKEQSVLVRFTPSLMDLQSMALRMDGLALLHSSTATRTSGSFDGLGSCGPAFCYIIKTSCARWKPN